MKAHVVWRVRVVKMTVKIFMVYGGLVLLLFDGTLMDARVTRVL